MAIYTEFAGLAEPRDKEILLNDRAGAQPKRGQVFASKSLCPLQLDVQSCGQEH